MRAAQLKRYKDTDEVHQTYPVFLWHWTARIIAYVARGIGCLPFSPDFFKTLRASYVVGASGALIRAKDFNGAFRLLKTVEDYDVDDYSVASGQNQLAWLYKDGKGVDTNEKKAFSLFQKAATAGNSDAIAYMRRQNAILRGK